MKSAFGRLRKKKERAREAVPALALFAVIVSVGGG
jgi:hypothetical protein